ncbi:DUF1871 family protein [Paenibacillus sp. WLX2291]|uniref:DUF1871 family protein n=1 Tax=Paenibacillus sp. WLX2291 TaxID=3296934 RepID=UPI00398408B4
MEHNHNITTIINQWNPIGIYPLVEDEYEFEIAMLINEISKHDNLFDIDHIAHMLHRIFKLQFAEDFSCSIMECRIIAIQIFACYTH